MSPALFNELRVQWAKDQEPGEANSANPEAIVQQGGQTVLTIGRNSFSPRETTIKRWQVADSVTWASGAHKVKGGLDFQFDDILNYFPGNFFGAYTFSSLASFTQNQAARYVQAFAGPGTTGPTTNPNIKEYSFFTQDEWRIDRDLTINAGLRYDIQQFAKPDVRNPDAQLAAANIDTSFLPTDTNNWGPRLGVTWAPAGSRYLARVGYGLFYGRTPSIMVGTADSNNGINVQTITFTGNLVPAYPNIYAALPTGAAIPRPTIFNFDRDYQNAKVHQASVGFEYQLQPLTSLVVNYLYVKGTQLPRSTDINVGDPTTPTTFTVAGTGQSLTYPRLAAGPFANFARIISFQSTADSEYNGLTIEVNRRLSNHLMARAAYTLGQGHRHGPGRHRGRSRQLDRRCQVRVEPERLRGRSHRRQQRSTSSRRLQRDVRHQRSGRGQERNPGRADPRLGLQRDLHGFVRSALLGARGERGSEQRRQHAQRLCAGHHAQPVQPAVVLLARSANRARHRRGPQREDPADLRGLQPDERRQHQQRQHDALRCRRHDAHAQRQLRPAARHDGPAHHSAGVEGRVLVGAPHVICECPALAWTVTIGREGGHSSPLVRLKPDATYDWCQSVAQSRS